MSRKFYKLLIIENPQPTIPHIPNRGNGIMECWNNEIITFNAMICQGRGEVPSPANGDKNDGNRKIIVPPASQLHSFPASLFSPQAFIGPKGANPSFQSIVSAAN